MRLLKAVNIGLVLICHVFLGKTLAGEPIDFETFYDQQLECSTYGSFDDFVSSAMPVMDYALEGLGLDSAYKDYENMEPIKIFRQKWVSILGAISEGKIVRELRLALEYLDECIEAGLLPLPTLKDETKLKKSFFQFTTLGRYFPRGFVPIFVVSDREANLSKLNSHPLSFYSLDDRLKMISHDLLHSALMAYLFKKYSLDQEEVRLEWQAFFEVALKWPSYKRIGLYYLFHEQPDYYRDEVKFPSICGTGVADIDGAELFEFVLELAIAKTKSDPFPKILSEDNYQQKLVCHWVESVIGVENKHTSDRLQQTKIASVVPEDVQAVFRGFGGEYSNTDLFFDHSVFKLKSICLSVSSKTLWKKSKQNILTDEEVVGFYRKAFPDDFWLVVKDIGNNLKQAIGDIRNEFSAALKNSELSASEAD